MRGGTRDFFGSCDEFRQGSERSEGEVKDHEGPLGWCERAAYAARLAGRERCKREYLEGPVGNDQGRGGSGKGQQPATAYMAEDNAVPHRYSHFDHPEDHTNSMRAAHHTSV
jgi:hypothetical protein